METKKFSLIDFLSQAFILRQQLRKFEKGQVNLNKMLLELKRNKYHNFKIKTNKFQCLLGKTFRVQKGNKVLRTYKIINIYGRQWVLFRERIFTRNGIREHIRVRYQPLYVLEKKLGRKVI